MDRHCLRVKPAFLLDSDAEDGIALPSMAQQNVSKNAHSRDNHAF